jgi:hypothetical protein
MVTNTLAETLGWPRKRLAAARKRLEVRYIRPVRRASRQHGPALYRWQSKGGQN